MQLDLARRRVDARHLVLMEVVLLGTSVLEGDLAKGRQTHAHHNGAFQLRADAVRVDLRAAVEGDVDTRDRQLALAADRNFDHGGGIADKAVMRGQAQSPALG